jgi:hypothetical protein
VTQSTTEGSTEKALVRRGKEILTMLTSNVVTKVPIDTVSSANHLYGILLIFRIVKTYYTCACLYRNNAPIIPGRVLALDGPGCLVLPVGDSTQRNIQH